MRELKCDGLVISATFCCLKFQSKLVKLDREEFYRHIAVKCLRVCPTLHSVFVCQFLVNAEECVKFIVINMSVLESNCIDYIMDSGKYLFPFPLVVSNGYCFFLCECTSCCATAFLPSIHGEMKVGSPFETSLHN